MTGGLPTEPRDEAGPELWRRAATLFERAVELPAPDRSAYLERVCGADLLLRRAVEKLLAFDSGRREEGSSAVSATAPFAPGGQLGAYRLVRPIAQGGMASVWLAERCGGEVEQRVAIKWIREIEGDAQPWAIPLFLRERQILATLEHPNIARFLDGGTSAEGLPFAVLEYVEGVPITQYCDARRLSVRKRLALFLKVCGAVQYAHQNLVVHRDLKPDNILVGDEGEPKLLDFGIAKPLQAVVAPTGTQGTGATLTVGRFLTPDYASPEQLAGAPVSMASDLYSLGVLLTVLLTGCLPRTSDSASDAGLETPSDGVVRGLSHHGEPPEARAAARGTSPRLLRRALRGDLDAILLRCLRTEPRERYGSVEGLAEDLRRHLSGLPVSAQSPSVRYRLNKFVRRNRVAVASGTLLALGAVLFVVTTVLYSRRVEQERDAARQAEAEAEAVQKFMFDAFRSADPYQRQTKGPARPREETVGELLDRNTARVATDLKDRPLVQARLYQALGGVYLNLGRYGRALPLLRDSLAIRRSHLGPEHPDSLKSLGLLGFALSSVGKAEEAEPLLRENLALSRKAHLDPHLLAEALTAYGMVEDDLGHVPQARASLEEALAVYRRTYSAEQASAPLAILLIQLGGVLYEGRSFGAARARLREALDLLHREGLEEHPDIASALHYLAKVEQAEGRFDAGEALFREALAMRVKVQGAEHPQAIVARSALGKLLLARGSHAEAARVLREVADLDAKVYGAASPEVAADLALVAQAAAARGAR